MKIIAEIELMDVDKVTEKDKEPIANVIQGALEAIDELDLSVKKITITLQKGGRK